MTNPLRDAHRDLTRKRIVDAALDLLRSGQAGSVTIAEIAARAGMTERTVYRHFENREVLMAAVWLAVNDIVKTPALPNTPEALIAQPLTAFPGFDSEEPLMRTLVMTEEGRALRLSVNDKRKEGMRAAVRAACPGLKEPAFTQICAVVQLLDSSLAWLSMRDYWGLTGKEAGQAASNAIAILLNASKAGNSAKWER